MLNQSQLESGYVEFHGQPMMGEELDTGSMSPTIVAKIVMDNMMVTPENIRRGSA